MKHNFKVGDKVKIPTQKTGRTIVNLKESLDKLRITQDTKFLVITTIGYNNGVVEVKNPNSQFSLSSFYNPEDLVPYHEEMTIPKILTSQLDGTIIEVQDIDGAIYKIDDKVVFFNNPGKPMRIRGFKWNRPKTNLLAITNSYNVNGIGINKIQLFVEKPEIKEETLLEKAQRLYPKGTKIKCLDNWSDSEYEKGISTINPYLNDLGQIWTKGNHLYLCIYKDNQWAEILEEVQPEFVLPERWCIQRTQDTYETINQWCNDNPLPTENLNIDKYTITWGLIYSENVKNHNGFAERVQKINSLKHPDFTEITFEQFKKYVLKSE